MIKQLITAALLAVSLNTTPRRVTNAPIQSTPKIVVDLSFIPADSRYSYNSSCSGSVSWYTDDPLQPHDWISPNINGNGSEYDMWDGAMQIYWERTENDTKVEGYVYCNGAEFGNLDCIGSYNGFTSIDESDYDLTANFVFDTQEDQPQTLNVTFGVRDVVTYSVTKTFNNCHDSGNTDYRVPDSFTSATLSNPYTIFVVANDGYFFKRDSSSYSFSSGVSVSSVDFGANPTAPDLPYSEQMFITFSMPLDNVSMSFNALPASLAMLDETYNDGYGDARAIYENTNQFAWLKSIWTGMAAFFAIEVLPNVSLGFLCFSPLLVVAILAIVRIIKHD